MGQGLLCDLEGDKEEMETEAKGEGPSGQPEGHGRYLLCVFLNSEPTTSTQGKDTLPCFWILPFHLETLHCLKACPHL